jgi:6-phosphogluconolactonase
MDPSFTVFESAESLARAAAEHVASAASAAIAARGRFVVALAGGSTPEALYAELATLPADWSRWWVFFGDERFVPVDDPRSNVGMARRTLLDAVPIPESHLFPIPTAVADPEAAARDYERTLRAALLPVVLEGEWLGADPIPIFDLILLGLGDDGHTASLFPGKPALDVADRLTAASEPGVLPPPVPRVTLTFPVINRAREVLFLVAGGRKAAPLAALRAGTGAIATLPALGVQPSDGRRTIYADRAAAPEA